MGEYGEPWTWSGEPDVAPADAEDGDRADVDLADASGKYLLISCSCCRGITADARTMERIVLCVNACRGFTDKELGTRTLVLDE